MKTETKRTALRPSGVAVVVSLCVLVALVAASCASPSTDLAPGRCEELHYGDAGVAEDDKQGARTACVFEGGALVEQTIGSIDGAPLSPPPRDKLKHVFVLMLENRSFDHLLGKLPGLPTFEPKPQPDGKGGVVRWRKETNPCIGANEDPAHEWGDAHLALGAGLMDGFAQTGGCGAMTYYERETIPNTYLLAETFAIGTRYFSSVLGPTWPNRMFFYAATSCDYAEGGDSNFDIIGSCASLVAKDSVRRPSIFTLLGKGRYAIYDDSGPMSVAFGMGLLDGFPKSIGDLERDLRDLRNDDDVPPVVFVGANTGALDGEGNDNHPPFDLRKGERFLRRVVDAISANEKVWNTSVLFLTYDENGGFYDHVEPPRACDPDRAPDTVEGHTEFKLDRRRDYRFDQLGFRVPFIAISPFAKRGFKSTIDADHSSILRFIEAWLGLGALTRRDANAWPLLDMFDFAHPNFTKPKLVDVPLTPDCIKPYVVPCQR